MVHPLSLVTHAELLSHAPESSGLRERVAQVDDLWASLKRNLPAPFVVRTHMCTLHAR